MFLCFLMFILYYFFFKRQLDKKSETEVSSIIHLSGQLSQLSISSCNEIKENWVSQCFNKKLVVLAPIRIVNYPSKPNTNQSSS